MKKGEEVMFEYGGHSNGVLFAEYGFVEMPREEGWLGRRYGQVDVGWSVDELWETTEGREEKEEVLRAIGCWGCVVQSVDARMIVADLPSWQEQYPPLWTLSASSLILLLDDTPAAPPAPQLPQAGQRETRRVDVHLAEERSGGLILPPNRLRAGHRARRIRYGASIGRRCVRQ